MKHVFKWLCVVVALSFFILGCNKKEEQTVLQHKAEAINKEDNLVVPEGIKKLIWVVEQLYFEQIEGEVAEQFNRMLLDKGSDFIVEFVGATTVDTEGYYELLREWKFRGEDIDLFTTGIGSFGSPIQTYPEAVKDQLLQPLDNFLLSEAGKPLYESLDWKAWESIRLDDQWFGIPQRGHGVLGSIYSAYINEERLKELNISLPSEIKTLWEFREMLETAAASNIENKDTYPMVFGADIRELLHMSVLSSAISVRYNADGQPEAINPFSSSETIALIEPLEHYRASGWLVTESEANEAMIKGDFLVYVGSMGYPQYGDGKMLIDLERNKSISAFEYPLAVDFVQPLLHGVVGVASWSNDQAEAMQLLQMIYTDEALSNVLFYGIENLHYVLVDNKASSLLDSKGINGGFGFFNGLSTHPTGLEPLNKKEVYTEVNKAMQMSPIHGFELNEQFISLKLIELNAIADEYESLWRITEGANLTQMLEEANRRLNEAGISEVLEEINKQLEMWWAAK